MPDPVDKSDDLIAELAKLMAVPASGGQSGVQPVTRPAPLDARPAAPAATPIRIPGLDSAPRPASVPSSPSTVAPQAEARAPVVGTIRIPGMDQPAPVSTSAPVSKFDFGRPVAPVSLKQEPLSTLSERLAAQNPSPPQRSEPTMGAAPVRIPSSLTPVSENKSFAQSPALSVAPPAPEPAAANDFHFDFGFAQTPPAAPVLTPILATPPAHSADPIADLIAAEMASTEAPEPEAEYEPEPPLPAPVPTMLRTATPGQSPGKPVFAPISSAAPARPASKAPIPLKPVSVAPRAPESDRFAISPGVGLNMKPPASQPLGVPVQRAPQPVSHSFDDSDPMSEIESLIGEAVRVELTPGPVRVQTPQNVTARVQLEPEAELEAEIRHRTDPHPAPVVPPLTTQFAPRRANLKEDGGNRSAEDAILAAAAASGAEVGRMEPGIGDESPYRRLKVKPQRSSFFSGGLRQYIGMAVAGTLLLAAGLGLYWVLNMGRTGTTGANAPVLSADTSPVKVKPAAATQPVTDAAKSPVLAKMDGTSQAASTEQLASTDQSTADVANATPATDDGADSENGLANRKVRTVTVRPDGTIVSGDDAVAGGEALPVERPNVPAVPGTAPTNLLGASPDSPGSAPLLPPADVGSNTAQDTQVADATQGTIDPNQVAPTPMTFPMRTTGSLPKPLVAETPTNSSVNALVAPPPKGQINLLGDNSLAPVTTQTIAKTQPAAPVASGVTAAAYVQLSSQPTADAAQASMKSMTAKYGALFGGGKLTVQQVDLGAKGVRWRVRLPAGSLADANSVCAQIKAQGGDCFATSG